MKENLNRKKKYRRYCKKLINECSKIVGHSMKGFLRGADFDYEYLHEKDPKVAAQDVIDGFFD